MDTATVIAGMLAVNLVWLIVFFVYKGMNHGIACWRMLSWIVDHGRTADSNGGQG